MCTVSIKVDDATMRRIDPDLNNRERISRWLQHHVNLMIEEMAADNAETMDIETARELLHQTVSKEYLMV